MANVSFLKVGTKYQFSFQGGAYNATLLEILPDGWIKIDAPQNPTWVNLEFIKTIHMSR